MDRIEPTDPMDRIDPFELIESTESVEFTDQRELFTDWPSLDMPQSCPVPFAPVPLRT